jgi:hypothetical protein
MHASHLAQVASLAPTPEADFPERGKSARRPSHIQGDRSELCETAELIFRLVFSHDTSDAVNDKA